MLIVIYIILFSRGFCLCFLTNNQFNLINQGLFSEHDKQYREILFLHSQAFARSMHFKFCKNSKYVERMTYKEKDDLLYYGYGGLWKATLNYNGRNNFFKYASYYIDGEIKRGVSDNLSRCLLPHRYRVNKKYMENNDMSKHFVTSFSQIGYDYGNNLNNELNNELNNSNIFNDINFINDIVNNLSDKERLYFTLRYDILTFKIERTYKDISEIMCVSEETARKEVRRITQIVISEIEGFS
jgi:RNA polymerase sigma factor (sigma-70 family)